MALVLPGAATASVWQDGYGPEARGIVSSGGPLHNETAFMIELPGAGMPISAPILRDGRLYVLTGEQIPGDRGDSDATPPSYTFPNKTVRAIFEVDLATATNRTIVTFDTDPLSMSADEERFYVITTEGLQAYRASDGAKAWAKPWTPGPPITPIWWYCAPPLLHGPHIYVVCQAKVGGGCGNSIFVSKIEKTRATTSWTYYNRSLEAAGLETPDERDCGGGRGWERLSVIGDYVYVAAPVKIANKNADTPVPADADDLRERTSAETGAVFQLRDSDGTLANFYSSSPYHRNVGMVNALRGGDPASNEHTTWYTYPAATGTSDLIFMRFGEMQWARPDTGEVVWRHEYEQDGNWAQEEGAGMAYDGRRLYFTTGWKMLAIDVGTREEIWPERAVELSPLEYWEQDQVTLSRGVLYAHSNLHVHEEGPVSAVNHNETHTGDAVNEHKFWAVSANTGQILWRRSMGLSSLPNTHPLASGTESGVSGAGGLGTTWNSEWRFVVGETVLAAAQITGRVVIVGRTAASIQPAINATNLNPAPGESVEVDFSRTKQGVLGKTLEYRVDWGDGEITDWQSSPRFSHAYTIGGGYEAIAEARNDAGQHSVEPVGFCVGCRGPQQLPTSEDKPAGSPLAENLSSPRGSFQDFWALPLSIAGAAVLLLVGLVPLATRRRGSLTAPRFRIESELGFGATSRVLLAHDTVLDRKVVLKQPLHPWLLERKGREQFLREAQILARLNHPNVVAIHEVLPHEEPPMLVLEYVPRGSLQDLLREQGPLPTFNAIEIVDDVLAALEHVHDHGIIHRDIKPANVLIADHDRGKLTDFNIAQPPGDLTSTAAFTRQNSRAGSPSYMSPEQSRGDRLDIRSDLYSAAGVLYEALTGTHYLGDTATSDAALVEGIQHQDPILPHRNVPPRLAVFLQRALAKEPSARFPNAASMRKALKDAARNIKPTLGSR